MNPALDYINSAPEPYRSILIHLQYVIEATIPEAQLKYKWRLPFYYLDGKMMFCFLNLGNKFVELGMPHGAALHDVEGLLTAGKNRKTMRSLRYENLNEINDKILMKNLLELRRIRLRS